MKPGFDCEGRDEQLTKRYRQILENTPYRSPDYEIVKELGQGGYGTVLQLYRPFSETYFALKIYRKNKEPSMQENLVRREAELLRKVTGCKNIVSYKGFYENSFAIFLLMECCHHKDVRKIFSSIPVEDISEAKVAAIIKGVLKGLQYLHDLNIAHRDIKPSNILLRINPLSSDDPLQESTAYPLEERACLGDLGLCAVLNPLTSLKAKKVCGTDGFLSPEQLKGEQYGAVICSNSR